MTSAPQAPSPRRGRCLHPCGCTSDVECPHLECGDPDCTICYPAGYSGLEALPPAVHEFDEDVADGSMCTCGVPALYHHLVEEPAPPSPAAKPGEPRCSACGSTAPHHLEYVRSHGVCVT